METVSRQTALGNAYTDLSLAVAKTESHYQRFSDTRDPAEKAPLLAAIEEIFSAESQIKTLGTDSDRGLMAELDAKYGQRLSLGVQMLNGTLPPSSTFVIPADPSVLDRITELLAGPTEQSRINASSGLARLQTGFHRSSDRVLAAIGLGLPILVLLLFVIYHYERKDALNMVERRRLELVALTDSLTSLGNHRAFQEDLRREVARAALDGSELSVVMMDLDDFKEINDSRGHASGDTLLTALGQILLHSHEGAEHAYRVGGDEFALILPDTPATSARRTLERLRVKIGGELEGVSISVGICSARPVQGEASVLVDSADAALYEAKRRGKNNIVLVGAPVEPNDDRKAA